MKKNLKKLTVIFLLLIGFNNSVISQVLISDKEGNPDASAMLEIKSTDKGLLIPRMTTAQRNLVSAIPGLLIYDTDFGSFFLYGKNSFDKPGWIDLSTNAGIWTRTNNNVYLSNTAYNVGIGTNTPKKKLVIKAENLSDTLFEIQDKDGYPLMVITPQLTKFNFIQGAKGVSGGFAVGRYATAKGGKAYQDTALLVITPDSTRIYTSGSAVTSGGFAVGRYATAKGKTYVKKSFYTDFDSTRVYTDGTGTKGVSGGFAVGRYATAKGTQTYNFFTDIDSTRVFTDGLAKGVSGGFAVGRYATAKGSTYKYMHMTPQNSFIGYQAGINTSSGIDNIFIGKNSGITNITGNNNVYIGNNTGSNASASGSTGNIFIGNNAGILEAGSNKLYISNNASDFNGALIYGDFSPGAESVNLNGNLRFNRGGNTIEMPTTRGNINEVLTTGAGGSTNWENVNNLVTFPATYVPPIVLITYENDFPFQDDDNIGTLIVKTSEGKMNIQLPKVEGNESRIIKVKNNRPQGQTVNVSTINPDIIEGVSEQPLIVEEGETYTFQAGVDKNTGETIWYIIDYTVDNQLKNLLKETAVNYNFNTDPDGERVYTLVITDAQVDKIIIPSASGNKNRVIVVKNASSEGKSIAVAPDGSDLIDGRSAPAIINAPAESYMLQSDGIKNWYIINHYIP